VVSKLHWYFHDVIECVLANATRFVLGSMGEIVEADSDDSDDY